ncbi:hypothetical protein [Halorhabdus sp. BNX81]|uniref:hypothetical protein n=1 Tax=Halorhabdus sp. BNX81 TaxID=2980181 RepID=UPI0023DD5BF5|nr:hypothetical protein [Halorhabdus sp. BNX81]WEL20449.1 Uncharacterized protein HBNXHr_0374 [Halorhabdus sp. BNX81]
MPNDSDEGPAGPLGPADIEDVPTITCERCGREWDLAYELEELAVGNQALEQFALDHQRHTGHFPDGVSTWQADCRQCPESVQRLDERGARRWAQTHARHTDHAVELTHADEEPTLIERAE